MANTPMIEMPKPRLTIDPTARATSVIVLSPNFIDSGKFMIIRNVLKLATRR
jgi:hypothetical protein